MSKIICDICGTTYPSSAESCPICGFNNKISEDILNVDINLDDVRLYRNRYSNSNKLEDNDTLVEILMNYLIYF